ncbi:MAG: hypothetical protein FWC26_12245 [Fibromonadales bacterium]|nr:hypothetical protein [Fibromonadales bacterium]
MVRCFILLMIVALLFSQSFGAGNVRCGTVQFTDNSKKIAKLAKPGCIPENFYGEVLNKKTPHFIIYYTLQKTHAVKTVAYIDSLAIYLEQAYKLHKDSLGMRGILGASKTSHYLQTVPAGLYPVEVVDTGMLRDDEEGDYALTFGLTFPPNGRSPRATQIVIENDFLSGADCKGNPSTKPFLSDDGSIDYSKPDKWPLALKVTTFHELYHSFQLEQVSILDNNSFWLEASATGVEEIGAPEVDDYLRYLSVNFKNPGKSMNVLPAHESYGYATLYLFLFSKLDSRFDSGIWKYFSDPKKAKDKFSMQLARLADSLGIDAEKLFHEYAAQVFYSGKRASYSYSHFWEDMSKWPEWSVSVFAPKRVLPDGAFYFLNKINESIPDVDSVAKYSVLNYGDSSVWVLSRLLEKEYVPETPKMEFTAYPNPWNPRIPLRFMLPENANQVEIRSASGVLLERIKGEPGSVLVWEPKKQLAPGILYYRVLPNGKNKVLLVEY